MDLIKEAKMPNEAKDYEVKDNNRCAICGWPLKATPDEGCMRGDCSMRPFPMPYYDYDRAVKEYAPHELPSDGRAHFPPQSENALGEERGPTWSTGLPKISGIYLVETTDGDYGLLEEGGFEWLIVRRWIGPFENLDKGDEE
jgi:hypothetical protein